MLLLILIGWLAAPPQRPVDVVRLSAVPETATVAPGGTVRVEVKARVQGGWKLYALEQPEDGPRPLAFAIAKDAPFRIDAKQIVAPKAKIWNDENFDLQTRYYENEVSFTVPVSPTAAAKPGPQRIPLEVTFQACGQSICLRPYTQKLDIEISISR